MLAIGAARPRLPPLPAGHRLPRSGSRMPPAEANHADAEHLDHICKRHKVVVERKQLDRNTPFCPVCRRREYEMVPLVCLQGGPRCLFPALFLDATPCAYRVGHPRVVPCGLVRVAGLPCVLSAVFNSEAPVQRFGYFQHRLYDFLPCVVRGVRRPCRRLDGPCRVLANLGATLSGIASAPDSAAPSTAATAASRLWRRTLTICPSSLLASKSTAYARITFASAIFTTPISP